MVSGFVTSPFDHSRIWSGLASEMRIALKLLTSSMVLLRAAVWLGNAMWTVGERVRDGHDADPRVAGRGQVQAQTISPGARRDGSRRDRATDIRRHRPPPGGSPPRWG